MATYSRIYVKGLFRFLPPKTKEEMETLTRQGGYIYKGDETVGSSLIEYVWKLIDQGEVPEGWTEEQYANLPSLAGWLAYGNIQFLLGWLPQKKMQNRLRRMVSSRAGADLIQRAIGLLMEEPLVQPPVHPPVQSLVGKLLPVVGEQQKKPVSKFNGDPLGNMMDRKLTVAEHQKLLELLAKWLCTSQSTIRELLNECPEQQEFAYQLGQLLGSWNSTIRLLLNWLPYQQELLAQLGQTSNGVKLVRRLSRLIRQEKPMGLTDQEYEQLSKLLDALTGHHNRS